MNLLFLQFNNYFNRIIKRYETVEDYISHSSNHAKYGCKDSNGSNFNPNDGIRTERTFNWAEKWNPDYLLCIDSDDKIVSRWYVIRPRRTRNGQYFISLKRDSVAEKLNETLNSICFVQKGHVTSENPLIFNKEDFNCNQIKKSEIPLFDKSRTAFIVLYYNKSKKSELQGTISTSEDPYVEIGTTLDDWPIKQRYFANGYKEIYQRDLRIRWESRFATYLVYNNQLNPSYNGMEEYVSRSLKWDYEHNPNDITGTLAVGQNISTNKNSIKTYYDVYGSEPDSLGSFLEWNNKLIKTSDNLFYRIKITEKTGGSFNNKLSSGNLFDTLCNCFKTLGQFKSGWSGSFTDTFVVTCAYNQYQLEIIPETNGIISVDYNFTNVKDVKDAVYGVLALPYDTYLHDDSFDIYHCNFNISKLIALDICKKGVGQDKVIFDCQILPYSPCTNLAYLGGVVSTYYLENDEYSYLRDSNSTVVCYALHPKYCKFSNTIDISTLMATNQMFFYGVGDERNYKVENQCVFYRLCSPNWNGSFEFNLAKNDGLRYINIDCTYKPYIPYIHVNPFFNRLYGRQFGDARGLVCGGDFSFGATSEKFEEYKLQNKNFQEIFNRQIESMDVMHKYGMIEQSASALTGIGAGAMSGMFLTGNPAGAIGGGVASAVGGGMDLLFSQKKFEENKSYAIDIHNYQLDNIKALPNSLTKIDAYNSNNKIWPVMERYCCTDEEIEIFKTKLRYEGMTINSIGKLMDYLNSVEDETFVKGQMVRFENLNEDTNFANDIYEEIAKGVYIYGNPKFN